jgi:uncharacterized coiled-coil protein SlyX
MIGGDRDGLIARIRQVRRVATVRDPSKADFELPQDERMRALEGRVGHLEQLLEGLQDSVHREAERHAGMIAELQTQVQPEAMRASLADDARNRGL